MLVQANFPQGLVELLQEVSDKVDDLSTQVDTSAQVVPSALTTQLNAISTGQTALAQSVTTEFNALDIRLDATDADIAGLTTSVATLDTKTDALTALVEAIDTGGGIPVNALTYTDGSTLTNASGAVLTHPSTEVPGYFTQQLPFASSILFSTFITVYAQHTVTNPISFTANATGAVAGYGAIVRLVANGVHPPSFTGMSRTSTSKGYANILGRLNTIKFFFDGVSYWYEIFNEVPAI